MFFVVEEAASALVIGGLTPSTVFSVWEEAVDNGSKKLRKACLR